jgi:hypothetical protein
MRELAHEGILPVLEIVERPPGPFVVMPWVKEGSLAERLERGKPLQEEEVGRISLHLARAVAHAHSHGVIHRDIKPGNVLLDADGHVWLTDFGLASEFSVHTAAAPEPAKRFGTAPYMSPAVAAGKAEDTRADVYSFGALLYELLAGCPPYEGATADEVVKKVLAGPPPAIRQNNPGAHPELAGIAERAMARELKHRYASMQDIVQDLESVITEGVEAVERDPIGKAKVFNSWSLMGATIVGVMAALIFWGGMLRWGSGHASPGCFMLVGESFLLGDQDSLEQGVTMVFGGGESRMWVISDGDQVGGYSFRGERLMGWSPGSRVIGSLTQPLLTDFGPSREEQVVVAWVSQSGPMLTMLGEDFEPQRTLQLPALTGRWSGGGRDERSWDPQDVIHLPSTRVSYLLATHAATGAGSGPLLGCLDVESGQWTWVWGATNTQTSLCAEAIGEWGPENEPRILVWTSDPVLLPAGQGDATGRVFLLNLSGELAGEIRLNRGITDCLVADVDQDGRKEVLIADRSGWVTQLDERLRAVKTRNVAVVPAGGQSLLRLHAVADMNADGWVEVVCSCVETGIPTVVDLAQVMKPGGEKPGVQVRLMVLGQDLEILSEIELGPAASDAGGFAVLLGERDERGQVELVCAGGNRLSVVTCAPAGQDFAGP